MNRTMVLTGAAGTLAGVFSAAALLFWDIVLVTPVVLGLGVVAACAVLALYRFAWLLLLLLAVRPSLDALRTGGAEPATAVGLIFLAASGWWLVSAYRSGRLARPSVASWCLVVLVLAAGLSVVSSQSPMVSAVAATRLAAGLMMFIVLEQLIRTRQVTITAVAAAVAASAALVGVFVAVELVVGASAVDTSTGLTRVTGPFVHASVLGKYAAIVAVLMVARGVWSPDRRRWLWMLGAVASTAVVGLTYTRAAWFAVAIGAVIITARYSWRRLPVLVAISVGVILAVPSLRNRVTDLWTPGPQIPGVPENSLTWRVDYWQDLLPLARINPANGIGLDVVPLIRGEGLLPHNVWVQVWVELGAVGLLALSASVIAIWLTLARAAPALRGCTDERRAALEAGIAVAAGLIMATLSENLLGETATLWYAAAVMAVGWSAPAAEPAAPGPPARGRASPARHA